MIIDSTEARTGVRVDFTDPSDHRVCYIIISDMTLPELCRKSNEANSISYFLILYI